MEYRVNDTVLSYHAIGKQHWGEDKVLLDHAIDLSKGLPWQNDGYTIDKLFDKETSTQFQNEAHALLISCWKEAGLTLSEGFLPDQYHKIATRPEDHLSAVNKTKLISACDFPLGIEAIEKRISTICNTPLRAFNPFDAASVFHFRVIRPKSGDNNPLHRDVWLDDYDNCINLYIPICGSNERSSLVILPGSHKWSEARIEKTERGAEINGLRFNVPGVTAIQGDYEVVRPNPLPDQVLVFSPYLIHGGAVNLNEDQTRISIELRLWKVD